MVSDAPRPGRSGSAPKPGIVHFGPGAFFRAFNAVYCHEAMEAEGVDWGIIAVSLKSSTARDQLDPQGGIYTALELGPKGETARRIGSVARILVAPEDPRAVIDAMVDPAIKIVSLTITEKGYGYDAATGGLDRSHPDIASDLAGTGAPCSAVGLITAALNARHADGTRPFTVLSCDNLPSNGAVTRAVVLEFARQTNPDLAAWIEATVAFPSTMVDRITPATTDDAIARLAAREGYHDPAMVTHEPFRQWVIEAFPGPRPAWEMAGAQFVQSVGAHEAMKLRCLNGTHSSLAYLGYLAGHETIAEAVADPAFSGLCSALWTDEILPTLETPEGEDPVAYAAALMARYKNPAIRHRLWQIAMDGSQKLPQRILATVQDRLADGVVPDGLCLVVAGWMRYVGGVDERGRDIDVRDPLADRLRAASDSATAPEAKVAALLAVDTVFDPTLAQDARFRDAVTAAYENLTEMGARAAVTEYLS